MNSIYCTIYVVKNKLDNKCYVGQTWQSMSKRFYEHVHQKKCKKLYAAIQKYGEANFKVQALIVCHSQDIANYWECYFMKLYSSIDKGYNIREGGSKGKHVQSTKDKLSKAHMGKRVSPKTEFKVGNFTGINNPQSKLDWEKVKEIREKYASRNYTYSDLSREYRVSISVIHFVVKNITWKV